MEGTEEDWHRRFLAAGVPLVILALPRPLGWLGGSLTIPLRVTQGDLSSLGVDMFNIGNLRKDERSVLLNTENLCVKTKLNYDQ